MAFAKNATAELEILHFWGNNSLLRLQLDTNHGEPIPGHPIISKSSFHSPKRVPVPGLPVRRQLRCMAQRGGAQRAAGRALEAFAQRSDPTGGRWAAAAVPLEVGEAHRKKWPWRKSELL